MQYKIIFILSLFLTNFSYGQSSDSWIRFHDTINRLSGYQDLNGNIKIPAKFKNFTRADTFYNIMAVAEQVDSFWNEYYLLKNGRKVGQDSVFKFDFEYDCESEGKILFKDYKTNRVGFFDKNGIAIIPAIYNAASPFRNGLAVAIKNAKPEYWADHQIWSGGEIVIINDKNEVLMDCVKEDLRNLNWYSLK